MVDEGRRLKEWYSPMTTHLLAGDAGEQGARHIWMDEQFSFGGWLRQRRKALDLTQGELARRVGCATVTLQKIELDERRPSRDIAERLAAELHLLPDERARFVRSARGELAVDQLQPATPPAPLRPRPSPAGHG